MKSSGFSSTIPQQNASLRLLPKAFLPLVSIILTTGWVDFFMLRRTRNPETNWAWQKRRDLNPCTVLPAYRISNAAPSTSWVRFYI